MQVSVETTTALERRLIVGVPAAEVDTAVQEKLKETAKQVRLDGFRPGKVPVREVKRRFGVSVRAEVVGDVIQRTYYEALTQEKLHPAGMPKIEPKTNEEGSDLEYVAVIEVYPKITLPDLGIISVEKPVAVIQDADVDEMIQTLRQQHKQWLEKEGEASGGDQVIIDYLGTKDGEVFEGGSADDSPLELGSNSMIPGFEDGIIGAKAGEERILDLSFPEDYHSDDLKGQQVQFKVTVKKVNAPSLPELNEEFYALFGVKEGGEEKFREDIRKNMARELSNGIKSNIKNQILESLLSSSEFDVPTALLDSEIDRQRQSMLQQFGGGQDVDPSVLPADLFREQAEKTVKVGLLFSEIIKEKELTVDSDKVKSFIEEMASTYEVPEEVVNYYYGNKEALDKVESLVLEEQVVELILGQAQVTEEVSSYQDVMKRPDANNQE
jgi:trigger factor